MHCSILLKTKIVNHVTFKNIFAHYELLRLIIIFCIKAVTGDYHTEMTKTMSLIHF